MAAQTIRVPNIGDFSDVEVIEVHVREGDTVAAEDPLITLETEKAAMDVPSPQAGKVAAVSVRPGDRVSEGTEICVLEGEGGDEAAAGEDGESPEGGAEEGPDAQARADDQGADPGDEESAPARSDGAKTVIAVEVPDIGDFSDVEVIDVQVSAGDEIAAEDPLITLETEKAAMDVPAPRPGRVTEVHVKTGDRVSKGDRILSLEVADGDGEAKATARAEPEPIRKSEDQNAARPRAAVESARREADGTAGPPAGLAASGPGFAKAHASPGVRKLARELGVDLGRVKGSGRKGRITGEEVKAWVKSALSGGGPSALPKVPEVDFARYGEIEIRPLGRIRRFAAPRLQASWINVPHVTQFDEADITDMEDMRASLKGQAETRGLKLTPLAFVMRACVKALQAFPSFTASLDAAGENLVFKDYLHIGFAADTEQGLLVPVVRDADKKDVYELAGALGTLSEKARAGKLKAEEMQGGCFTISSLGGIGGTAFTPIVNAPEVAILGVSRARMAPVYRSGGFVPRLMLPLSLSYDHRVIDGAEAARFTRALAAALEDVPELVQAIP